MSRKVIIIVFVIGLTSAWVASSNAETVIGCSGYMEDQVFSTPENAKKLLMNKTAMTQRYIVGDDYIIVSGNGRILDVRLPRCEATAGQYRYSNNCKIKDQQRFAIDWINESDVDPKTSQFYKKYMSEPESIFGGRFITLNRATLHLIEDDYSLLSRLKQDKKIWTHHNYIVMNRYEASCTLAKSKV